MPTEEQVRDIKRRATPWLLALPGVNLVTLGGKTVAGAPAGVLAIRVFLDRKRPVDEVPAGELIPAWIEGVPTDVVVGGAQIYAAGPPGAVVDPLELDDDSGHRPLLAGTRLMPENSTFAGSIGCFVQQTNDPKRYFIVTNNHVCGPRDLGPAKAGVTRLGHPDGSDSCTKCCSNLVGTYAGGGGGPDWHGGDNQDRDEALVLLDPGTKFQAEILDIGPIAGTDTVTLAQAGAHTFAVRKRGARTKLTGGVVTDLEGTTTLQDNLIVVTPNPNPAAGSGTKVFFLLEGDSGAALVSDANKVVGIVKSYDADGHGFAFPIQHVLDRLGSQQAPLKVLTATHAGVVVAVPAAAMIAAPPEIARELVPDAAAAPGAPTGPVRLPVGVAWPAGRPAPALLSTLRADLERTRAGRMLVELWLRHQRELADLLAHNRRIKIGWYRGGGAALFQLLTRMADRPDTAIPRTVNGVPLAACVEGMQEMFAGVGSFRLREDLARARRALPDLASLGGLTYPQVIEALGATGGAHG